VTIRNDGERLINHDQTAASTLRVGDRVWWKHAPEYRGRVTQVKGERRKRYMVRWDAYEHDSGEYGISEFLIEARLRRG
jgi:hypothetical protein